MIRSLAFGVKLTVASLVIVAGVGVTTSIPANAISTNDLNDLAKKSCGAKDDEKSRTCRTNYRAGYKAGESGGDKAKTCGSLTVAKKNCESGFTEGKADKADEDKRKKLEADAKTACKDSSQKTSCEKGYVAAGQGKSKESACKSLSGTKKTACEKGYSSGASAQIKGPNDTIASPISLNSLPDTTADDTRLDNMANIAFGIAGSLAMLFTVIGGVRYIMSQGDPQKVSQAKNTILYAVIGLVVTISAFAIVKFILSRAV